ncbi:hypothetical protein LSAT2_003214 [Lamellibrachia satsuma]|nr:hypothetical protein LSAT2_003214 [Lamellibrachia satsuma]
MQGYSVSIISVDEYITLNGDSVFTVRATVWQVDYIVSLWGESVAPDVLPTLSPVTLMASFPTRTNGEVYSILVADISSLVVLDSLFTIPISQYVKRSVFKKLQDVIAAGTNIQLGMF